MPTITLHARAIWKKHIDHQLGIGGGSVFSFISRDEKAYVNVDLSRTPGDSRSTEAFFDFRTKEWSSLWQVDEDTNVKVAAALKRLRQHVLDKEAPIIPVEALIHSIKTYKKTSKGIDCWGNTELKQLPECAVFEINNVLNHSLEIAANPHQNLVSLHPFLGKPGDGVRTISKTPMIFRNMSRCLFYLVQKWEGWQYI